MARIYTFLMFLTLFPIMGHGACAAEDVLGTVGRTAEYGALSSLGYLAVIKGSLADLMSNSPKKGRLETSARVMQVGVATQLVLNVLKDAKRPVFRGKHAAILNRAGYGVIAVGAAIFWVPEFLGMHD